MLFYSALVSAAPNYAWVLILRLLAGVCVVGVQSSFILYLGEITPSSFRALFVLGQVVRAISSSNPVTLFIFLGISITNSILVDINNSKVVFKKVNFL